MSAKRKIIIPAAGFGTRSKKEDDKSKELLPRGDSDQPLILEPLLLAAGLGTKAHVIVRSEKLDLCNYLTSVLPSSSLEMQIISESEDWAETILLSKDHWAEYNVVLLPDLEWGPHSTVQTIFETLEKDNYDAIWGGCNVPDPNLWGIVHHKNSDTMMICEKPSLPPIKWAWGIIGFKKDFGQTLFENIFQSSLDHKWKNLKGHFLKMELDRLEDFFR